MNIQRNKKLYLPFCGLVLLLLRLDAKKPTL